MKSGNASSSPVRRHLLGWPVLSTRVIWIATLFLTLHAGIGGSAAPDVESSFVPNGFNAFELDGPELTEHHGGGVATGWIETSDGVTLRFLERGEGRPIVMVAGWTMPAEVWSGQLEDLSVYGRVIAFDPRGQGASDAPRYGYTIERRARDLAELIQRKDLRDVVLVGWSLGVFDVLGYIRQNGTSRVASVVLIDGEITADTTIDRARSIVASLQMFQNERGSFSNRFVRSLFRTSPDDAFVEHLIRSVEAVPSDASVAIATNYLFLDMSHVVAELDRPLLFLGTPQMEAQATRVHQLKSDAIVRIFGESGHAIFFDEADEVNRLIRDLL